MTARMRPGARALVTAVLAATTAVGVGALGAPSAVGLPSTGPTPAASASVHAEASVDVAVSDIDLNGPAINPMVVTVTNSAAKSMSAVTVSLAGPVGWTVSGPQELDRQIKPGESREVTFWVQVPQQRSGFRTYDFTATVTYRGGDGLGTATATRSSHSGEIQPNLAAAFNNVGVTDESATTAGQFDSEGNSFSAQKLAEVGVTPGATVTAVGATFTWPSAAPGTPGNVTSGGQAIAMPGQGSRLAFLGSGSSTAAVGNATVYYTDGSSSSGSIGFPNWSFQDATAYGATLVASSMGRNRPDGYGDSAYAYRIFANSIAIDPAKTVEFVVLPSNGTVHVFDMAFVP